MLWEKCVYICIQVTRKVNFIYSDLLSTHRLMTNTEWLCLMFSGE